MDNIVKVYIIDFDKHDNDKHDNIEKFILSYGKK